MEYILPFEPVERVAIEPDVTVVESSLVLRRLASKSASARVVSRQACLCFWI